MFYLLLYCRIYTSAFTVIDLKIIRKFPMGLHLHISHHLICLVEGFSPIRTLLVHWMCYAPNPIAKPIGTVTCRIDLQKYFFLGS
jgi:hypothetical protein